MARVNVLELEPAITLLGNEYFQILQPNGLLPPVSYTDKKATLSQFAALATGQLPVAAHFVNAGPTSGPAALPSFRALVATDIPNLDASILTSGTVATARLGSGVADTTTFLRGDSTWVTVSSTPADGSITYAKIQNLAGLSVMGRASNSSGVGADITAASDFQVLRRSGASIGFGAIDLSQSAAITNDLPFANLTQGSARSVLGVTGNATADVASIQGTADQVLVVNSAGTALAFGAVNLAAAAAVTGDLAFANLAQGTARSVLGVTGNATADFASIQGTADQVLVVNGAGTALSFSTVATAGITAGAVTYAKIQNVAGLSVVGRSANSSGVAADITGTANQFLQVNAAGTTLGFVTLGTDATLSGGALTIANAAVTYAKFQNIAGLSVAGRSTNSSGVGADITGTTDQVLRISTAGTALGFGSIATAGITDAAVTYAKIQNIAGMSVAGRSTNSSGVGADITGTTDQVLRVNTAGTALGFGSIATAGITAAAVTYAKIQNVTTNRLLGRATAGSGDTEEITLGTNLSYTGTTLNAASSGVGAIAPQAETRTASATITIPTNATKLYIIMVGGGGGGGGGKGTAAACPCPAISGIGGSGGGGAGLTKYLTGLTPGNTLALTIGAAGGAGAATPTSGTAGGNSTLASGSQTITTLTAAGGGLGALGNNAVGADGAGGAGTNGDSNHTGQAGGNQLGGGNPGIGVGNGGRGRLVAGAGNAASAFGGGGGGGFSINGTGQAGSAGTAGIAFFFWFP